MARSAKVPILPTVIWGSQRVWTKGRKRDFGRHKYALTVAIGEPMDVPKGVDPEVINDELRRRMTELLHQVQDSYPDKPRDEDDKWWLPARLGGTAPTLEVATKLDADEADERARKRAGQAAD